MSHVMTALAYNRTLGNFDAGRAVLPHSAEQPLDVEAWCEFRWRRGQPPTEAPVWEEPSSAQVCHSCTLCSAAP